MGSTYSSRSQTVRTPAWTNGFLRPLIPTHSTFTTKNSTIGRVSTVPVTVDTRLISHVYTVHVARSMRITVGRVYFYTRQIGRLYFLHTANWPRVFCTGRVYFLHASNWPRVFNTRGQLFLSNIY
jgi:hypothetical protein